MLEFDTGVGRCEVQLALKCRHCDHTPIQGRAVRRIGELLEEFHGGAPNQYTKECGRAATCCFCYPSGRCVATSGEDRTRRSGRAAEFEEAIESDNPPSVTQLAELGKKQKPNRSPRSRYRKPLDGAFQTKAIRSPVPPCSLLNTTDRLGCPNLAKPSRILTAQRMSTPRGDRTFRRAWNIDRVLNGLSGWCASRFAEAVGHDAKCIDCASPSVRPDEMAADLMLKASPGGFAAGLSDDRSSVALATSYFDPAT